MMTNTNSSRLFQFYMDSFFKFPKDIRNDMIYCQRVLRDHIKVHQMVLDVFEQQPNQDPAHRNRILEEIESEIYEINAEQQFLFLRLRRVIDEFYKMLKKNNIPVEPNTTNNLISREVVPYIKNSAMKVNPVAVQARLNEELLIQKYFEVQEEVTKVSNENGCEVIDLCDNDDLEIIELPPVVPPPKTQRMRKSQLVPMSLLKPIDQRLGHDTNSNALNAVKPTNVLENPKPNDIAVVLVPSQDLEAIKNQEVEASKSVKMSRMNLRQALKRAHNVVSNSTTPVELKPKDKLIKSPTRANEAESTSISPPPNKKQNQQQNDAKPRSTRAATQAAAAQTALSSDTKSIELVNSSSDDSNLERDPTSPHPYWPDEVPETRSMPIEYGQEMFLRFFGLFTSEMLVHMQQRRSKRRRRPVQSNERSDYHYGRLEPANFPNAKDQKKERKTFLLSPQAKAKKPKRSNGDKPEEAVVPATTQAAVTVSASSSSSPSSRSNSSSPNEKLNCNECLKAGGVLENCSECKAYYHQACHDDDDVVAVEDEVKPIVAKSESNKQCPPCKRKQVQLLKKEKIQNKTLQDTAKDLEKKMALQRDRRAKLQNASKLYKLQMLNLLNIVKKIQTDKDNDSSE